jgi:hypothetical protein
MPIERADRIVVDKAFVAKTVEDIFLKYRADLIQDLRESLINVNRDQPGDLLQSIDGFIKVESNNISFELVMNNYWKFVDKGVDGWKQSRGSEYKYKKNGKRIPLDAMKKFIKFRGLVPKSVAKPNKRVNKKLGAKKINAAYESYAWALGAVIKRDGLRPTHFFTNVINEDLKDKLTKEISEALKKDIEINFTTS